MSKTDFNCEYGNITLNDNDIENIGKSSISKFVKTMKTVTIIEVICWALVAFYLFYDASESAVILTICLTKCLIAIIAIDIYIFVLTRNYFKLGNNIIKGDISKIQKRSKVPYLQGTNKNVYIRSISDYHAVLDVCLPTSSKEKRGKLLQSIPLEMVKYIEQDELVDNKSRVVIKTEAPDTKFEIETKGVYAFLLAKMFLMCVERFKAYTEK